MERREAAALDAYLTQSDDEWCGEEIPKTFAEALLECAEKGTLTEATAREWLEGADRENALALIDAARSGCDTCDGSGYVDAWDAEYGFHSTFCPECNREGER